MGALPSGSVCSLCWKGKEGKGREGEERKGKEREGKGSRGLFCCVSEWVRLLCVWVCAFFFFFGFCMLRGVGEKLELVFSGKAEEWQHNNSRRVSPCHSWIRIAPRSSISQCCRGSIGMWRISSPLLRMLPFTSSVWRTLNG